MNILSIDLDWIMEPSIEAYNHITMEDRLGPARMWEKIMSIIPNINLDCDLSKFHNLYFLLLDKGKHLVFKDIYIGYDHHEIYNFLLNSTDITTDTPLHIVNIDHHHDLGYPELNDEQRAFNELSIANWMYYINKDYNVQEYMWINNKNSLPPREQEIQQLKKYIHTTDLTILDHMHFDKIFFCTSWEWVPLKYETLFEVLVSTIDKR